MERELKLVNEFHKIFKIPTLENPSLIPKRYELRHRILAEEVEEYLEGNKKQDLENVAKELGDVLYITYCTILEHGLQDKMPQIFEAIHKSNMSKLDDDGNPILREDGKILKSKNYIKADIRGILEK